MERELDRNEGDNLSSHISTIREEQEGEAEEEEQSEVSEVEGNHSEVEVAEVEFSGHHDDDVISVEDDSPGGQDPRTKVLSVLELEDLFVKASPDLAGMASLSYTTRTNTMIL
jgi:large subunit GTPase 1